MNRQLLYRYIGWAALMSMRLRPLYATYVPVESISWWRRFRTTASIGVAALCLSIVVFSFVSYYLSLRTQYIASTPSDKVVTETERPQIPIPEEHVDKVTAEVPKVVTKTASEYQAQIQAAPTAEAVRVALGDFGEQYGLSFAYDKDSADTVTELTITKVTDADLAKIKQFALLFVQEWSKYPKDWLQSFYFSTRPTIVPVMALEAQLDRGKEKLGGLYTQQKKRFIYYNVDDIASFSEHDYTWGRGAIHHEAGHAAMMATANVRADWSKDPAWENINPVGFIYGSAPIDESVEYYHPSPGFVTQYARFSIDEDQAEVFSYIMTTQYQPLLASWSSSDTYLSQKSELTKKRICDAWQTMCGNYFSTFTLAQ